MNDGTEDVPRSSSTNVDAAIHNRALRFAATFDFANPRIVTSSAARDEFVTRYGTPGTTEYREIEIHMDWSPGHCEMLNSSRGEERVDLELFVKSGIDLLIVCSSTDIIHHEFLGMDFD